MVQPLFLQPVLQERIWGGTTLRDEFGYAIPSETTGECWGISAHPNGPSIVENGPFAGKTLDALWKEYPELFGNPTGEVFPLLTKVLDANDDLSVQVHPNDTYARVYENGELGKTECWYIIDCKEDADMIFGHTAQTKEEFEAMIAEGKWNSLLRRVKIKPGDFFYVPSGTIHALCRGTLVLETQQSSDTTYRVYDYDRTDKAGNKRELHLEKAIDVTTVPHEEKSTEYRVERAEGAAITTFVEEEYFSVYKWDVDGSYIHERSAPFLLCSVLDGQGSIETGEGVFPFEKGAHFIIPAGLDSFTITGKISLMVSHP
ncbi:mannose-6-phosphate isomerase, class I [Bacillus sp. 165]|uniref:mannose-6-phosphate isomerase, class I n=1 Tax=Bacillus sp. 165 TaxID=1529117 RepID=UPI001ADD44BC|nr:mannose-6-phosphate isomerase, class I [Bacillus sp. 165]MBO9130007.1 mannose-6-phosphate isomerase, class I [Bacillus sp. 165]